MKKPDLGQAIQILANVGVIAGIVFLGFELRQNNEQLSAQARYNYYAGRAEFQRSLAFDPAVSQLILSRAAGAELSPQDRFRLERLANSVFTTWEYEYGELKRGLISEEEFSIPGKQAIFPLGENHWEEYRRSAPADFVEFVEREIRLK